MKRLLNIIAAIQVISQFASAQVYLDTNNVTAYVDTTPVLFWNKVGAQGLIVPAGSGKSTLFSSSFWIGGLAGGSLYLSAETYRQSGQDFRAGPLSNSYQKDTLKNQNIVRISREMIDEFRTHPLQWADPPDPIKNWPANPDMNNGQGKDLAPFVNVGGDPNVYEPSAGDYPRIKGDLCIFNIFNDDILHTNSGSPRLKIEVQRMVFAFSDTSSFLNNSIFVNYRIVNRSMLDYDSVIFGQYSDFDIGKYDDDFIGSDSTLDLAYAYNGDSSDEGANGYGLNPPAEGMMFLNIPMGGSMFFNNDFTTIGNPSSPIDYYRYLGMKWKDGNPLTYDGTGKGGSTRAWFAFSGDPCQQTGWTEKSASLAPGDRRSLCSSKPFSLPKDSSLNISIAFIYARDFAGANSSVCALKSEALKMKNWYANGGINSGMEENHFNQPEIEIYPNPSDNEISIKVKEPMNIEVYGMDGKRVTCETRVNSVITLSNLTPGVYMIHGVGVNGRTVKKVVIY